MRKTVAASAVAILAFQFSPPAFPEGIFRAEADAARPAGPSADAVAPEKRRVPAKTAVAKNLNQLADVLAKKRLAAYALGRYSDASPTTRERFAANFAAVAENDPKAEIHPAYLVSLQKRILNAEKLKEDGALFGAYVHVLLAVKESGEDVERAMRNRKTVTPVATAKAYEGKTGPDSELRALETLRQLSIAPFDAKKIDAMRKTIETEYVGTQTRYFQAYAYARKRFRTYDGAVAIAEAVPHRKQVFSLSCESNSIRDLFNAYRLKKGESPIAEEAVVFLLPSYPKPPEYRGGTRIWADPEKEFVGLIGGKQSSNPDRLTGYGIHAEGALPYVRRELKRYGVAVEKGGFDGDAILRSLAAGNPVVFWYALSDDPNRGFARLSWVTPEGKPVTGYVGQHTGIIVGAKLNDDGSIREISYYEGKNESLQTEPFDSISRKAKWFNAALYPSEDPNGPQLQTSKVKKRVPVKKKNALKRG